MLNRSLVSSNSNEWATPQNFLTYWMMNFTLRLTPVARIRLMFFDMPVSKMMKMVGVTD